MLENHFQFLDLSIFSKGAHASSASDIYIVESSNGKNDNQQFAFHVELTSDFINMLMCAKGYNSKLSMLW